VARPLLPQYEAASSLPDLAQASESLPVTSDALLWKISAFLGEKEKSRKGFAGWG
jgi:hypothetical protein